MQDGSAFGYSLREAATQLLCLLLVLAILLLSLGPMLDHHFAERHPGHQHFYLGSADQSHPHGYQESHVHDSSWVYGSDGSWEGNSGPGGIVYLMPNDGAGHSAADITIPMAVQSARFGGGEGNRPPTGRDESATALSGASISPSVPPPRA